MKETALITGASQGLGMEFAKLCAADKADLVLVARNGDSLKNIAATLEKEHGIAVTVIAQDLSVPDAVAKVASILKEKNIDVTVLINNAGFGSFGKFHETAFEKEEQMLKLNIEALTALTKALLPPMVARKHGRILNVASTAAFLPGPLMAVYYATKAYVLNFSLAIREELKGTGVTVTCLCPGPTRTGFEEHAGLGSSKLFKGFYVMDAITVAKEGYDACNNGRALVIPGTLNRISTFLTRLIPRTVAARIARNVQSER